MRLFNKLRYNPSIFNKMNKHIIPGIILSTVLLTSCGSSGEKKEPFLNCTGPESDRACDVFANNLPIEVSGYIDYQAGEYRYMNVIWDGDINVTSNPNIPLGSAGIRVWREKGEILCEIERINIDRELPEEQIEIVIKKEVYGHAVTLAYILLTHEELLDPRMGETNFASTIAFVDKLSHLTLTREELQLMSPDFDTSKVPLWDGNSALTPEVLEFVSWLINANPNQFTPRTNEIIQMYLQDYQEKTGNIH
ncbi:MAG: hypothetical protein US52_C0014G0016 [candidate division WS6 bacterium GW2011_GWA2_37_6]|uniref:Uncharacterized protein n=1 Tax=candidate division WS6 bacterium GW2011_GWA2_37_6 TaxID=1619087 RepID=A0A0G0K5F0_9BACT|nr:MAG: hypothetical protein US52_C0014G0016 [candidate division WS6 bacterium GW2011_GWA2_37_6]